jgi:hypothetical protein
MTQHTFTAITIDTIWENARCGVFTFECDGCEEAVEREAIRQACIDHAKARKLTAEEIEVVALIEGNAQVFFVNDKLFRGCA